MSTYNDEPIHYSAHVWIDDGKVKLTIRRAVPAGIDGPFGGLNEVSTLNEVETYLYDHGYALARSWKLSTNYAGLNLDADLIRR